VIQRREELIKSFFRDLHSNFLTGVVPELPYGFVNLASNFFFFLIPQVPQQTVADFRFNYFNDCDALCCFLNLNCNDQCSAETNETTHSLPFGVEKSVWTELNVTLLGEKKRVIQIETHFSSSPHFVKSYACPNTSSLNPCNSSRVNIVVNDNFDVIPLTENVPYLNSQKPNTYQKYSYVIQRDVCTASVKVILFWFG